MANYLENGGANWQHLCPKGAAHTSPGQGPGEAKAPDPRVLKERRIPTRGARGPHPPRCGVPSERTGMLPN